MGMDIHPLDEGAKLQKPHFEAKPGMSITLEAKLPKTASPPPSAVPKSSVLPSLPTMKPLPPVVKRPPLAILSVLLASEAAVFPTMISELIVRLPRPASESLTVSLTLSFGPAAARLGGRSDLGDVRCE